MEPLKVVRILVIDDNILVRSAMKMMLGLNNSFAVVGEADCGNTGIDLTLRLKPDVVLMDISMQPMDGITTTRLLLDKMPLVTVIGFSALPNKEEENRMLEVGAAGIIHKSASTAVIYKSILEFYESHRSKKVNTR